MPVCSVLTQGTCACVIGHIELAAEINAATYNSEGLQSPIKLTGPRGYHPIGKFLELAHGFYLLGYPAKIKFSDLLGALQLHGNVFIVIVTKGQLQYDKLKFFGVTIPYQAMLQGLRSP